MAAALLIVSLVYARDATPKVSFLDVGQGDSALIRDGDREMLIDGGPDRTALARLGQTMPFFDRTIEYAVLTHAHADHLNGLMETLTRYRVLVLVVPPHAFSEPAGQKLLAAAVEAGTAVTVGDCGDRFAVGRGQVEILWPCTESLKVQKLISSKGHHRHGASADGVSDNESDNGGLNNLSLIMRLTGADRRPENGVLFMGDAEEAEAQDLMAAVADIRAKILKVSHHGSRNGTSTALLERIRPMEAVISVGRNNYGHPSPAVLTRLKRAGIRIWRTDQAATVSFPLR